MTVRSDILAAGVSVGALNTYETMATVPSDEVWIVKEITLYTPSATANVITMRKVGGIVFVLSSSGSEAVVVFPRWIVFDQGDVLEVRSSAILAVRWHLSGARLQT